MNAAVHCSQELLLQADFDGELDAAQSAALQAHVESCAICGPALSRLQRSRSLLARAPHLVAPERLRASVRELAKTQPRSDVAPKPPAQAFATRLRYVVSGAGVGAVAAGLLTFVFLSAQPRVADSVVDNHLRAMQSPAHLVDVASSEHHTVKPWFAGQIDFAPPVKDLEAFGYPLRGGRVDVVDGRNAAVLVYQAGAHLIDVSVEPRGGGSVSAPAELRGFNVRRFEDGDFSVWAVSDLNARELDAFVETWRAAE
jgi:anti-sigma factor RsiW